MGNKKEIGAAFREKLDQLDKTPSDAVWQSINADLNKKKKRRFGFFFLAAAMGVLLLLISAVTFGFFDTKNSVHPAKNTVDVQEKNTTTTPTVRTENKTVVQNDTTLIHTKTTRSKTTTTKRLIKSNASVDEYEVVTRYKVYVTKSGSKTITTTKKTTSTTKGNALKSVVYPKTKTARKGISSVKSKKARAKYVAIKRVKRNPGQWALHKKRRSKKTGNAKAKTQKTTLTTPPGSETQDMDRDVVATSLTLIDTSMIVKKPLDTVIKKKPKREYKPAIPPVEEDNYTYYVGLFAGPDYYNSLSKSASLVKSGSDFEKKGGIAFTYGINAKIMFNERIGVRFGFSQTNAAYTTTVKYNDLFFSNLNINFSGNADHITLDGRYAEGDKIDLRQTIHYMEMPLECYYVFDNTSLIGVDGFAGITPAFAAKNEIVASSATTGNLKIGKPNNYNIFVPSLSFGVLFHYKWNERVQLELSPVLKYQLKPFSGSNFNPILIALQAGFSYRL